MQQKKKGKWKKMEKKGKVFFYCKEEGVGGGKSKAW